MESELAEAEVDESFPTKLMEGIGSDSSIMIRSVDSSANLFEDGMCLTLPGKFHGMFLLYSIIYLIHNLSSNTSSIGCSGSCGGCEGNGAGNKPKFLLFF